MAAERKKRKQKAFECKHLYKKRTNSTAQQLNMKQSHDIQTKGIYPEGGALLCKFCRENAQAFQADGIEGLKALELQRHNAKH